MPLRKCQVAAAAAFAALSICVPAIQASAEVTSVVPALGGCDHPKGTEFQGRTGGNENNMCLGTGLQYVGPAIGGVTSVVGATAIGAVINAPVVTSGGNGATAIGKPIP